MTEPPDGLRQRLLAGNLLAGCLVKTGSHQVVEVLGHAGLDLVMLDAAHAPFGIETLDRALVGAAATGLPALVRVPGSDSPLISACLDAGAIGIVVPHVQSAAEAAQVVAAARFTAGLRGVSPSGRAANYGGMTVAQFLAWSDHRTIVCCQIEDRAGLDQVDAICAVPGVDCLLVGRTDLMVSLGAASLVDPPVEAAVARIAAAARPRGVALAIFLPTPAEIVKFRQLGFSIFLCGSDQSLLRQGAVAIVAARNAALQ
jgi:2-keto-3-deoxy-L-rhamnonate aldolase RhmA